MKTPSIVLLTGFATALIGAIANAQPAPDGNPGPPPEPIAPIAADAAPPGEAPGEIAAAQPAPTGQPDDDQRPAGSSATTPTAAGTQASGDNSAAGGPSLLTASSSWSTNGATTGSLSNMVRMSFHDAPLTAVMNYLSDMYGFIITGETSVRGKASIIANTPIGYKDAIDLLNSELTRNGYQAVQTGPKSLTIMSLNDAKKNAGTPVINDANPTNIPVNETIVTEILPIQSLNPQQLAKDLQSLFPDRDTLTANEAGNALIMTAPQSDVHRLAEMIKALDSTSVSDVKVFALNYADAKSVAQEIKDIFTDPNAQQNNMRNFMRMRFGGGPGGFGGMGGGGGGGGDNTSSNPIRVNAVSDDNNNSVLVSAPVGFMEKVEELIQKLDQPSEDVTVLRVFHLKHADPQETADELTSLFPDDTANSNNGNNRGPGFSFFGGRGGRGGGGNGNAESERMKRKSKVIAVADRRTGGVIVTAAKDLMTQIASMIEELDKPDPHAEVLASFNIGDADPSEVNTVMQDLFMGTTARPSSSTTTQTALQSRTTQNAQQQSSTTSSSGFGGGGGVGTSGLH